MPDVHRVGRRAGHVLAPRRPIPAATTSHSHGTGTTAHRHPDVSTTYLVNSAHPGPRPEPQHPAPRRRPTWPIHAFADACLYDVALRRRRRRWRQRLTTAAVVLVRAPRSNSRSAGYWQHQYRRQGHTEFTDEQAEAATWPSSTSPARCSARYATRPRSQPRSTSSTSRSNAGGERREARPRAGSTAWLNFANGAVGYNELFDADGNGTPDTTFSVIMATAEAVRADPTSTPAQLREQRQIVHRIR